MLSTPAASASSTPYWMIGLSTRGSISLGCAFVAGRNRVPSPAAGNTAFEICIIVAAPQRCSLNEGADAEPSLSEKKMHGNRGILREPFANGLVSGHIWIAFIRPVDEQ